MTRGVPYAFQVWLNVVNALLLRDVRARAGRFYVGYVFILVMPLLHLGTVLTMFVFTGRVPMVGTNPTIYFGISTLPFVLFVYPSRQLAVALATNRPLLYFPRVKIFDIFVARGLLEFANGMIAAVVAVVFLSAVTGEFSPRDPFGVLCALLLTLYLGFGWGAYNALLAQLFHFWIFAFNVFFPLLWLLSGIILNVHGIPEAYQGFFTFNPLFQCVEYIRYSYYEGYPPDLLDVWYAFWFGTCLIASSFCFERMFRRVLLSK